jgi:hypothetical protein
VGGARHGGRCSGRGPAPAPAPGHPANFVKAAAPAAGGRVAEAQVAAKAEAAAGAERTTVAGEPAVRVSKNIRIKILPATTVIGDTNNKLTTGKEYTDSTSIRDSRYGVGGYTLSSVIEAPLITRKVLPETYFLLVIMAADAQARLFLQFQASC